MNPQELLRIARQLANGGSTSRPGTPSDDELRRAISTAYYALFHSLAASCADTLIGTNPISRKQVLWEQTYRTLEHGRAKERCARGMIGIFPQDIQSFAAQFVDMQSQRHDADYKPSAQFSKSEVLRLINESEIRITAFENKSADDRRAFAVYVLFDLRQR